MTTGPRLALWFIARADALGAREALVGDLLEEVAGGRSAWWLWQQLLGWGGCAIAIRARHCVRVTPTLVALATGTVLVGGLSFAPLGNVLETWICFYLFSGTASLLAHVTAPTAGARTLVIRTDAAACLDR